ncbi:hypothetical protein OHZ10_23495 [Burkholderia arboris]|uniref:Uncharacterized protein n=1 Tax=Burkholderia arboris TaxID=488730 RepID=A0ABZ3DUY7_9BURK|nr:hypothetical protein [Burkholderia arboris]MCA8488531.1 hypothetical protein [Burkholderia arboris]
MSHQSFIRYWISGAMLSLLATLHVNAAESIAGKQLSPQELAQYAHAPSVRLDGQTFKHLNAGETAKSMRAGSAGDRATLLVNERGVVGETRNELVVSQVEPDRVREVAGQLGRSPVATAYFAPVRISTLRFASFEDAVEARAKLIKLLPQARVNLPIRYATSKAR